MICKSSQTRKGNGSEAKMMLSLSKKNSQVFFRIWRKGKEIDQEASFEDGVNGKDRGSPWHMVGV